MPNFSVVASFTGALCFIALALVQFVNNRSALVARAIIAASVISAAWLGVHAAYYSEDLPALGFTGLQLLEVLRNLAWLAVFAAIFHAGDQTGSASRRYRRLLVGANAAAFVAVATFVANRYQWSGLSVAALSKTALLSFLSLAIIGLILIEQLYRNVARERRWSIKFLCLGVGAIYAYDFVLYADGLLFNQLNPALWAGRGAANAVAVPLIAISASRNRGPQLNLFVSRQLAFHSTALLGVGAYLLAMASVGYALRAYGGEWGSALRVVFLFAALVLLVTLLGSAGLRSRLRLFLAQHFYRNKYDYGEVWLSFTNRLSKIEDDPGELRGAMLKAIADIMDATGGALWQRGAASTFTPTANWEIESAVLQEIPEDHPLIDALGSVGHVIDIREEATRASLSEHTAIPFWLLEYPRAWLLIPIVHREKLVAFVLLCQPRTEPRLSWEDRALMTTVGRQAASYLALMDATAALADARQFEAFNRLSAFLVHDLKNVVAQLSLVTRNAEKHRGNPEFITDVFTTVGDAVAKMNRMLGNLRHAQSGPTSVLDLHDVVREAVAQLGARLPAPRVLGTAEALQVVGNRDRVVAAIEHLLQNAQDATPPEGSIQVRLAHTDERAIVEIIDTGSGMTQDFIQNRLFKPFDTTKGKAGMGIGVYESLHIVTSVGGRLTVESTPSSGTTFKILLPRYVEVAERAARPARLEKSA